MDSLGHPSFTQSDIDKVCKMYGDVLPYRLVLTPENPLAVITHTGEDDKFYKYNRLRCLISSLGPGFSDLKISQFNTWNTSSEQTLFNKIKHGVDLLILLDSTSLSFNTLLKIDSHFKQFGGGILFATNLHDSYLFQL
jgi:hypothetical protein